MFWLAYAMGSAFFNAAWNTLNKKLLTRKTDKYLLAAVSLSIAAVVCLALTLATGLPEIRPEYYHALPYSVFFEILALLLYLKALELTDVSLTVPLLALTPALLLVVAPLITGEIPSAQGSFGVLLVAAGSYVLAFEKGKDLLQPFKRVWRDKGMLCMLGVAVVYALTASYYKLTVAYSGAFFAPGVLFAFEAAVFWAIVLWQKRSMANAFKAAWSGVADGLSSSFLSLAMLTGSTPYVIAVRRTSILFTVGFSHHFLGEQNVKQRLAASLVMVAGVILIALG